MGMENLGKNQKPKESSVMRQLGKVPWVREGVLAATLFAGIGHAETARSAEIAPNTTWSAGTNELFRSAQQEKFEVATFYVNHNGKEFWLSPVTDGSPFDVSGRARKDMPEKVDSFLSTVDGPAVVCQFHSHPRYSMEYLKSNKLGSYPWLAGLDLSKKLSLPPSPTDAEILKLPSYKSTISGYLKAKLPESTRFIAATVDDEAIWYYEKFSSDKSREEFMRSVPLEPKRPLLYSRITYATEAQANWVRFANSSDKTMKELLGTKEYQELRYAYADLGVQLRAVPREDVENEPNCAGANYSEAKK
jgi:hypothetical protein